MKGTYPVTTLLVRVIGSGLFAFRYLRKASLHETHRVDSGDSDHAADRRPGQRSANVAEDRDALGGHI